MLDALSKLRDGGNLLELWLELLALFTPCAGDGAMSGCVLGSLLLRTWRPKVDEDIVVLGQELVKICEVKVLERHRRQRLRLRRGEREIDDE